MNEAAIAVGPGTERDYVSLGKRTLAALLDNSVWLFAYIFFFGGIVSAASDASPAAGGIVAIAYFSLWFNYFSFCEWRWGQTIGKNATGIMVTSLDGGKLTFGAASMRNLLRLVDWLVIGWVMIASNERHQRLGDKVADTVVVRRPPHTGTTMKKPEAVEARLIAGAAEPLAAEPTPPPEEEPEAETGDEPKTGKDRKRLPDISWTVKRAIWGLIAGLVLAIFSSVLVLPFDTSLETDGGKLAAQGLFGLSLLVFPIGIASGWDLAKLGVARVRLGLRRFAPSAIGWALLALFAYYIAAAIYSSLIVQPDQEDIGGELGVGGESTLIAIAAVFAIVVVAPISEEIFFRGFFFSGLRSRLSFVPAAVIAGLVFGSVHAPTGITTVIPLAALGMVLCWIYEKTGSLWPCIFIHMINNGIALALLT